ncbi:hypothetical protein OC861_002059 [Tilletia horrida]|nr:hypothetical protein OC861_002059 [Tilletia horrida]
MKLSLQTTTLLAVGILGLGVAASHEQRDKVIGCYSSCLSSGRTGPECRHCCPEDKGVNVADCPDLLHSKGSPSEQARI